MHDLIALFDARLDQLDDLHRLVVDADADAHQQVDRARERGIIVPMSVFKPDKKAGA
ncbi:MAG TPA: hypothetical protein VM869_28765 [Enhygromyxa sp.]|nr:hypothetical protein [Enhygromyxa sp.]